MLPFAHFEREPDRPDGPRLGQQALDGELEVVDLLEREVHTLGDAADDQAHDAVEVAGERRLEVDALRHHDFSIVPSPTTQSSRMRHASCPGATACAGSFSASSSEPGPSSRTRHASGFA